MRALTHNFKKIIALCLALVMSMSLSVFAESEGVMLGAKALGANSAEFQNGTDFNAVIKALAGAGSITRVDLVGSADAETAGWDTSHVVSTNESTLPIYAHYENGVVSLWSSAEELVLNTDSANMFSQLPALQGTDLFADPRINTSGVEKLDYMFRGDSSLSSLDLTCFDSSSVSSSTNMFEGAGSLASLTFGADWAFKDATCLRTDINWERDNGEIWTTAALETRNEDISGTFTATNAERTVDTEESVLYYGSGLGSDNFREVHTGLTITGFCINESDPNPYGYYDKIRVTNEMLESELLTAGTDFYQGGHVIGDNIREAMISIIYYGNRDSLDPDLLQIDIWHITDEWTEEWDNADYWADKRFEDIPDHDKINLYIYKSRSGHQNVLGIDSIDPSNGDITGDNTKDGKARNIAYADKPSNEVVTYQDDPVKKVYNISNEDIDGEMVQVGEYLIYKITVKNLAEKTKLFTITDEVPENSALDTTLANSGIEDGGVLQGDGKTIKWEIRIPARYHATVTFRVKATEAGAVINNQAKVAVDDIEVPTNEVSNKTPLSITIKKTAENAPDPNMEFSFTASFSGLGENAVLKRTKGAETVNVTAGADGTLSNTFTLKAGENVVFGNIPVGATYQVKETHDLTEPYTASYSIVDAKNLGHIAKATDTAANDMSDLTTAQETGDEKEDVTITFHNAFSTSANLKITKKIEDHYNAYGETSFLFDIVGTTTKGAQHTYHVMLTPGLDLTASAEIEVENGTYVISEHDTSRYGFVSLEPGIDPETNAAYTNVTVNGKAATVDLTSSQNGAAEVVFTNEITHWEKLSHSGHVVNHISAGEEEEP